MSRKTITDALDALGLNFDGSEDGDVTTDRLIAAFEATIDEQADRDDLADVAYIDIRDFALEALHDSFATLAALSPAGAILHARKIIKRSADSLR